MNNNYLQSTIIDPLDDIRNVDNTIILFTLSSLHLSDNKKLLEILTQIKYKSKIALISGSEISKIKDKFPESNLFDYIFAKNGFDSYFQGKSINLDQKIPLITKDLFDELKSTYQNSVTKHSLPSHQEIILDPTYIKFKTLNGTAYTFTKDDIIKKLLNIIYELNNKFSKLDIIFYLSGNYNIKGTHITNNKSFCINYLKDFKYIFFFGTDTFYGGNDFLLFQHHLVNGNTINNTSKTIYLLENLFLQN